MKENANTWCNLSLTACLCTDFACESLDRITSLAQIALGGVRCFVTLRTDQRVISSAGGNDRNPASYPYQLSVPLENRLGKPVGDFHIWYIRERELTDDENRMLHEFAQLAMRELELQAIEERYWNELELAKKVQQSVLTPPVHRDQIAIDALYQPSEQLSGDLYCWFPIDEHRYGIIILDVMGHGVSASLVIMSIRALLRGLITRVVDPVHVIQELNQHISNLFKDGEQPMVTYVTGIYLVIDTMNRTIEYVNAGHPVGFFQTENQIRLLDAGGIPLGVLSDASLNKEVIQYDLPCRIFLYTDGLVETLDSSPIQSKAKLEQILAANRKKDHPALFESILANKTKPEQTADDICMISITIPGATLESIWGEGR